MAESSCEENRLRGLTRWIHGEPLLAVVLWGGVYPVVRLALREIPVLSFTFLRLLLGATVLCALWLPFRRAVPRRLWAPLVNAGFSQVVFQILAIASLRWTTAGQSAILFAASPIVVAGWLALRRHEHLAGRRWSGLLAGLAGVCLVVQGASSGFNSSYMVGDFLALGAAAAWAWFSLAIGPVVASLGMWQGTGLTLGIAALVFSPLALFEAVFHSWWSGVSWGAWGGLLYGATAGFVLATVLWGQSLHRLGLQQTMPYAYLEPVSAVVLAAIILGESLSAIQAAGGLLTLVGVWLASDSGIVSK